ncbi:MAG: rhodanese-like domain-containing protein [Actinobacteria bacterium]|nr:rhodanese-like domain-containing protein [Actinomycetota bacterium]
MVLDIDGKTLKAWMDSKKDMIIVDARAPQDYKKARIPGAVSLLNADVEKKAEVLLKKGVSIIVYSNDENCPASGLVAKKLDSLGYSPVYDYNPSYADWTGLGYPVQKALNKSSHGSKW